MKNIFEVAAKALPKQRKPGLGHQSSAGTDTVYLFHPVKRKLVPLPLSFSRCGAGGFTLGNERGVSLSGINDRRVKRPGVKPTSHIGKSLVVVVLGNYIRALLSSYQLASLVCRACLAMLIFANLAHGQIGSINSAEPQENLPTGTKITYPSSSNINDQAPAYDLTTAQPQAISSDDSALVPLRYQDTLAATQPADLGPKVNAIGRYNLFGGAPPVPGTRRLMADGEAPEDYIVEPGDTLYDIGSQLLDEPGYWPKLWALNPEIPNPHFIYPGMHLRFYPGDLDQPPFLEVITEDDVVPIDKEQLKEEELVVEDITGLLMNLKDPEPIEIVKPDTPLDVEFNFEFIGAYADTNEAQILIPAFVFKEESLQALGQVIIGPDGRGVLGNDDKVLLSGSFTEGTTYLVMRPGDDIYAYDEDQTYLGSRYEYVASVKVLKSLPDNQVLGQIPPGRIGAVPGDLVIPYRSIVRRVRLDSKGLDSNQGNGIVGFTNPSQMVGGSGDFVFFDKLQDGLQEGQALLVHQAYKKASLFYDLSDQSNLGEAIATIVIIDVSSEVAIGYCINNQREMRFGDQLNAPKTLSSP